MNSKEAYLYCVAVIECSRGDDLARAKMAFRNCTQKQMDEKYGASDFTRREIMDGYEKGERKAVEALAWLETVKP